MRWECRKDRSLSMLMLQRSLHFRQEWYSIPDTSVPLVYSSLAVGPNHNRNGAIAVIINNSHSHWSKSIGMAFPLVQMSKLQNLVYWEVVDGILRLSQRGDTYDSTPTHRWREKDSCLPLKFTCYCYRLSVGRGGTVQSSPTPCVAACSSTC